MFLLGELSEARISEFLRAQRCAPLSHSEVWTTREGRNSLAGYAVDHNRVRLGEGAATFERAVAALRAWKSFEAGWMRVVPPDARVEAGATVAVLARHHGFRSPNACALTTSN